MVWSLWFGVWKQEADRTVGAMAATGPLASGALTEFRITQAGLWTGEPSTGPWLAIRPTAMHGGKHTPGGMAMPLRMT
jgi:hypothetical protein